MNVPVFVLTGGDPIKRTDLFELIQYGTGIGVRVSLTPSATPLLTREIVHRLKQCRLARLAVSLDGPNREVHDPFRGMAGSFERTMEAIEWANEFGLPVQINTSFSRANYGDFDAIAALMQQKQITLWSVFFLVPTGRGKLDRLLTDDEFEDIFAKLYSLSKCARFHIKTTEAQHYRRYVLQQQVLEKQTNPTPEIRPSFRIADSIGRAPRGLNDGKGFVFISHVGEVYPSGFLAISGGNVGNSGLAIFIGIRPFSNNSEVRTNWAVSVGLASSATSVEGHEHVPSPCTEIRLLRSLAVRMYLNSTGLRTLP
jgi:MoaA/NifB/PqqE/SkfB family radical SAM enzyme